MVHNPCSITSTWLNNGTQIPKVENVNNCRFFGSKYLRSLFNIQVMARHLTKAFFTLIFEKAYCAGLGGRDNGFGRNYVWAGSLESGLRIATHHNKPVMLIIHKSWCSACKNLKPKFANSEEIQSLSKHFVMINLVDDEEPKNHSFSPDGAYIPRILFISPNGDIDQEIYNEDGSSQHKFFYSRPDQIVKSMKKVLQKYKHEQFDDLSDPPEANTTSKPNKIKD